MLKRGSVPPRPDFEQNEKKKEAGGVSELEQRIYAQLSSTTSRDFSWIRSRGETIFVDFPERSSFCSADLRGMIFVGNMLRYADFSGALLTGARFQSHVNFTGSNFSDADLRDTVWDEMLCTGADFCTAQMDGMRFATAYCGSWQGTRLALGSFDLVEHTALTEHAVQTLKSYAAPSLRYALAELRAGRIDGSIRPDDDENDEDDEDISSVQLAGMRFDVLYQDSAGVRQTRHHSLRGVLREAYRQYGEEFHGYHLAHKSIEQWILGIPFGETPKTNEQARILEQWLLQAIGE